jgi:hypothetical protein
MLEGLQKGLLNRILGVFAVVCDVLRYTEELAIVSSHELLEGRYISIFGGMDKIKVMTCACHCSELGRVCVHGCLHSLRNVPDHTEFVVALLGLHDDFSGHLRVHPAVEWVFSRFYEFELEFIVRVERCRFELALRTVNGMGDVVLVDPSHLRARFDRYYARTEDKIVDLDFRLRARWRSGRSGVSRPRAASRL